MYVCFGTWIDLWSGGPKYHPSMYNISTYVEWNISDFWFQYDIKGPFYGV